MIYYQYSLCFWTTSFLSDKTILRLSFGSCQQKSAGGVQQFVGVCGESLPGLELALQKAAHGQAIHPIEREFAGGVVSAGQGEHLMW